VAISREVAAVLLETARAGYVLRTLAQGAGTVTFQYVPMMCDRTPISLSLLDRFATLASDLLGRSVLPRRAKGAKYYGDTGWHRDSGHEIASVGVVTYLDRVDSTNGALWVLAGSHAHREVPLPSIGSDGTAEALDTEPGDVIVFDEHLIHGSHGGGERRPAAIR